MKKIMLPVLIILLMTAYTPAVHADLAGSTVLSISLANYDPDPAIAGDTVDVYFAIENNGGMTTNDLMFEVVPSYPFELVSGENAVQSIGVIPGYQPDSTQNVKVLKYTMLVNKDAPAGNYELQVKYYEPGSTQAALTNLYLEVKSQETAEVIQIDKSTIVPGQQSSLKFTINNLGNAPLQDLTFSWDNDQNIILPVGSDNTRHINYIGIGNSTDLEYQVIADTNAVAGLYKLNLHLSYNDYSSSNQTQTIETSAGVYVGGGTDFDVAFSDNSNGQTSFSVANTGSNPANSVSVIIPDQPGWSVSGPNSVIVGNLNKGDYTVASFKLQSPMSAFRNSTGGSNPNFQGRSMQRSMNGSVDTVRVQIAYTDTMGNRNVVEKQVTIGYQNLLPADGLTGFQGRRGGTQQSGVFSNNILYFFGLAVLLVGAVVIQRKYKSRKMLNPDFKIKDLFKREKK